MIERYAACMTSVLVPNLPLRGTPGDLLELVRSGMAASRSDLARLTGLAPSTISLRVDGLLRLGLLAEPAAGSHGGRKARKLALNGKAGYVASVDLGASHVRIALADLRGSVLFDEPEPATLVDEDIVATAGRLWGRIVELIESLRLAPDRLLGIAVGVPAPVSHRDGRIVSPAFMPAWNNQSLSAPFKQHTHVPVLIENDANLYAIAESPDGGDPADSHLLAVKLGTRIGCGIISAGAVHRGYNGAAGEIAHTQAHGESALPCSCNVPNCLESVASGGALLARLDAAGIHLGSPRELVEAGEHGRPEVVDVLRDAGRQIGATLSGFVNFFNPKDVVIGGTMSYSAPLVAAIRAELFRSCLPLVTENLDVRATGSTTGLASQGGLRLALDTALQTHLVNEMVSANDAQDSA